MMMRKISDTKFCDCYCRTDTNPQSGEAETASTYGGIHALERNAPQIGEKLWMYRDQKACSTVQVPWHGVGCDPPQTTQ